MARVQRLTELTVMFSKDWPLKHGVFLPAPSLRGLWVSNEMPNALLQVLVDFQTGHPFEGPGCFRYAGVARHTPCFAWILAKLTSTEFLQVFDDTNVRALN